MSVLIISWPEEFPTHLENNEHRCGIYKSNNFGVAVEVNRVQLSCLCWLNFHFKLLVNSKL